MPAPGTRVTVHYNLNRGGFSVTVRGRVVAVVRDITLAGVTFRVQPGGLARIRREGRHLVCAHAAGVIEAVESAPETGSVRRVTFNPHRADTFTLADGTPVRDAPCAVFAPGPGERAGHRRPGYGWIADPP